MTGPAVSSARFGARNAQPLESLMGDARSVLDGLFPDNDALPVEARIERERIARVRGIAARLFGDRDGLELLEALCDATVRRPVTLGPYGKSCEEVALYAKQREGQNETIYLLLAWIAEGRAEKPPNREGQIHEDTPQTARNKPMGERRDGAAGRRQQRKR